jgi:PAS domain S-box-containing protein
MRVATICIDGTLPMPLIGHSLASADGRILAVDPQICEIVHREERELIGVTIQSITHPDDAGGNHAALMALRIQDGPLSVRKRYVRPGGASVWSTIQVSRLRADDGSKLVGTVQLLEPTSMNDNPEALWRCAKRLNLLIRRQRTEFSDDLFNDYAWLILLHIYIAEAEACDANSPAIAESLGLREPSVERWLRVLEIKNLIERSEWTNHSPQLTVQGISKIEQALKSHIDF